MKNSIHPRWAFIRIVCKSSRICGGNYNSYTALAQGLLVSMHEEKEGMDK